MGIREEERRRRIRDNKYNFFEEFCCKGKEKGDQERVFLVWFSL